MNCFSWRRRGRRHAPPPADAHVHLLTADHVQELLEHLHGIDPSTQQALVHVWQQYGVRAYLVGAHVAHGQLYLDACPLCATACSGHAYQVTPKHKDPS